MTHAWFIFIIVNRIIINSNSHTFQLLLYFRYRFSFNFDAPVVFCTKSYGLLI